MYCKKRAASKGGESEALKPLKQQPMLLFVLPLRSIPMLQAYHVRSTCSLCHQDCHWVFCCWLLVFVYGTCTLNQSSLFTPQVLNTFLTWIDPTRTAGVHVLRVKPRRSGLSQLCISLTDVEFSVWAVFRLISDFRGPHRTSPQMVVFFRKSSVSGNLGWWNIIIWSKWYNLGGLLSQFPKPFQVYWL